MRRVLLYISFTFCIAGCSHVEQWKEKYSSTSDKTSIIPMQLSAEQYVSWVDEEKNGLKVSKTIRDITYSILYKPLPYEALLRLSQERITDSSFSAELKNMDSLQYITLKIKSSKTTKELLKMELKSSDEYYSRIEYCSFHMQDDITLIEGEDTLACRLFHFERVYDIAPEAVFVMAFPMGRNRKSGTSNKIFSFDDRLFDNGKINLGILKSVFENIPQVKINN